MNTDLSRARARRKKDNPPIKWPDKKANDAER
jgi:hypothetical protein